MKKKAQHEANKVKLYGLEQEHRKSRLNPSNAKATFIQSTMTQKKIENHLNPVMLVFIGKLSLSTVR